MFDQFKTMGAVAGLLRDRGRLKSAADEMKRRLDSARLEGQAGDGVVRVVMSGRGEALDVEIAPALLASGDATMVAAAVRDAMNDALAKTQAKVREEGERTARELGLPDGDGLARMLGGP